MNSIVREMNSDKGFENQLAGTRFEFKILAKEKRNSIMAVRSAGSHSPADIISFKKNGEIWLISCKANGYFHPKELAVLEVLKYTMPDNVRIKLAYYTSKKKYKVSTL